MLDSQSGVGFELHRAFELSSLALLRWSTFVGKSLVYLLGNCEFIIECLEIDTTVGTPRSLVCDAVAHAHAVDSSAAIPAVCGIVAHVAGEEVEEGDAREWRFVRAGKGLVVAPRRTH